MRSLLLSIVACVGVFLAAHGQSLDTKVSFHESDIPVYKALRQIEGGYNVSFAYDSKALRGFKVSADVDSIPLNDLLFSWLNPIGFEARAFGESVVIAPKRFEAEAKSPSRFDITVHGRILDAISLEPLPFASVAIVNQNVGAYSNNEGYFTILNVKADTCLLEVSYIGFSGERIRLTPDKDLENVEVLLHRNNAVLPVATVEVVKDKSRLPGLDPTSTIIDVELANTIPNLGEPDPIRLFQLMPGVGGALENSGAFHVRGGAADENLILFDGFTIYYLDHFFGIFSAINANSVKHMQLNKGVLDARLGGRASSVLEITGKQGNLLRPSVKLDFSPISMSAHVETPILAKRASMMLSFRRSFTDVLVSPTFNTLFTNVFNNSISSLQNPSNNAFEAAPNFRFFDFSAKVGWESLQGDKLSLAFYSGYDRLELNTSENSADDRYVLGYNDRSTWGSTGVGFTWNKQWSPTLRSTFSAGVSGFNSELFGYDASQNLLIGAVDTLFFDRDSEIRDASGRFELEKILKNHRFTAGVNSTQYNVANAQLDSDGASLRNEKSANLLAVFAQDEWSLSQLSINAGARISRFSNINGVFAEPRIRATFPVSNKVRFTGGYGRNFQFIRNVRQQDLLLNTTDEWRLVDGDSLPVLRVDQFSLGGSFSIGVFKFTAEGFLKFFNGAVDDALRYPSLAANAVENNILTGTATSKGVEFMLSKSSGKHTGWVAYTISKAENSFSQLSDAPILARYDRRNELKLVYTYHSHKWDVGAVFIYADGLPYTPVYGTYSIPLVNGEVRTFPAFGEINEARLPAYHRLDLSAKRKWQTGKYDVSLGAGIFNVYNRVNVKNRYYYVSGTQSDNVVIGTRDLVFLGVLPSLNLSLEW